MTEHDSTPDPGSPLPGGTAEDVPSTGHPAVDEVLRSLRDLDERPVDEHVGVFERAHDALRTALSDAGRPTDDQPDDQPDDRPDDQPDDQSDDAPTDHLPAEDSGEL